MSWRVRIAKRVSKQVKRLPEKDVRRLSFILQNFIKNPFEGDIEKLAGEESTWRRRVGVYRIIYEIFPKQRFIFIEDIRRRTDTTYR